IELMFLSGRPFCMCSQPAPPFGLRNAPSREANMICPAEMVTPRMLVTCEDKLESCQVEPPSFETRTVLRVASAIRLPSALTETKSCLPITGPPLQLLPWLELVNSPAEVAAIQVVGVISTSFTRAVRIERVSVFVLAVCEEVRLMTSLIGLHSRPLRGKINMPRFVPATRSLLLVCFKLNTSRPSRPLLFCVQCCPASCETKTPPISRSLTTPTKMVLGSFLSAMIEVT